MKVAYFSPLPPQRTGIADYSEDLLPYLSEHLELTLFVDQDVEVETGLGAQFPVRPISAFPAQRWDFDIALYHMGNSLFHQSIYDMLRRYPGLTVLHDYTLHHFAAHVTVGEGDFPAYVRELAYAKGHAGVLLAYAIQSGKRPTPLFEWPLNERVVDLSLGIMVHSDYVRQRLLVARPAARIRKINQPIPIPPSRNQSAVRSRLDLPEDAFIVIACGRIIPEKRPDLIFEAFARVHRSRADAVCLIVGEPATELGGWEDALQAMGLSDAVRRVGYVEGLDAFYDYIAASDVCINLRCPTAGETSGSVLRAMAVGRPVIVSNLGWYAELPDGCCLKLDHNGTELETLAESLLELANAEERRREMGVAAKAYVTEYCEPRVAARAYVDLMQTVLSAL